MMSARMPIGRSFGRGWILLRPTGRLNRPKLFSRLFLKIVPNNVFLSDFIQRERIWEQPFVVKLSVSRCKTGNYKKSLNPGIEFRPEKEKAKFSPYARPTQYQRSDLYLLADDWHPA